jgi:hypothetical protein
LVDHVVPQGPVRQWMLSFPKRLRYFLHRDRAFCIGVLLSSSDTYLCESFLNGLIRDLSSFTPKDPPKTITSYPVEAKGSKDNDSDCDASIKLPSIKNQLFVSEFIMFTPCGQEPHKFFTVSLETRV